MNSIVFKNCFHRIPFNKKREGKSFVLRYLLCVWNVWRLLGREDNERQVFVDMIHTLLKSDISQNVPQENFENVS